MRQGANDTSSSQGDDVQFIKEEDNQQRGTKRARSPDKEEKKRSVKQPRLVSLHSRGSMTCTN